MFVVASSDMILIKTSLQILFDKVSRELPPTFRRYNFTRISINFLNYKYFNWIFPLYFFILNFILRSSKMAVKSKKVRASSQSAEKKMKLKVCLYIMIQKPGFILRRKRLRICCLEVLFIMWCILNFINMIAMGLLDVLQQIFQALLSEDKEISSAVKNDDESGDEDSVEVLGAFCIIILLPLLINITICSWIVLLQCLQCNGNLIWQSMLAILRAKVLNIQLQVVLGSARYISFVNCWNNRNMKNWSWISWNNY